MIGTKAHGAHSTALPHRPSPLALETSEFKKVWINRESQVCGEPIAVTYFRQKNFKRASRAKNRVEIKESD